MPYQESPDKQKSISKAVSLNNACLLYQGREKIPPMDELLSIADAFYGWLSKKEMDAESKEIINAVIDVMEKKGEKK